MTKALTLPNLPPIASIDLYVSAVNQLPMLSAQEEKLLAKKLKLENDLEAARTLVMSHLRLVVAIARKYKGYGLQTSDLIQEGNVGLMKAVKRFDYEKGVRLVSFAVHWIKAEIHEFVLKNWRIVKVATTKAQRKLFFNLRKLRTSLDTLDDKETAKIAQGLDVKEREVREMETRLTGQDISLDPIDNEEDDYQSPMSYLTSCSPDPSQELENLQNTASKQKGLSLALEALDERSREIIKSRWLREDQRATLHDLAKKFDISAERVRQIEAQAMKKMRSYISETNQ